MLCDAFESVVPRATTADCAEVEVDQDDVLDTTMTLSTRRLNTFGSEAYVSSVSSRGEGGFVARLTIRKVLGAGLGFDFCESGFMRVNRVDPDSPAGSYNDHAPIEERIGIGDFVVDVNGVAGDALAMKRALMTVGDVEVSIQRPYVFVVPVVSKGGFPLGLRLKCNNACTSLLVRQVLGEGAVHQWNANAPRERQVIANDHVVSVNGTSGDAKLMRQLIASVDALDLVVARPRPLWM